MADKEESAASSKRSNWFARHKVLTVILAVIVIAVIASASNGSSDNAKNTASTSNSKNSTATQSSSAKKGDTAAAIGTPVRDGKFEFTVTSKECGLSEVVSPDSDMLRKTAQGQYCVVKMNVKNIGNEQQGFFSTNQKLLDANRKQYASDDVATAYYSSSSSQSSWAQINPGNNVDVAIVFDLPQGITPTMVELHDSAYSNGVTVNLQ